MSHYFENDKNLKSEIKELSYKYDSSFFAFYSDNGVFSKDYIDYGSRLLLESYMKNARNDIRVLDVGCGYGYQTFMRLLQTRRGNRQELWHLCRQIF